MLDPCFKVCWCSDDKEKKNGISLLNEATDKVTLCTHIGDSEKMDNNESQPPSKKPRKERSLFNFMPQPDAMDSSGRIASVDDYIATSCVPMNTNPTKFWKENEKKFPVLASLAKEVLSVPSSSSLVERLFSIEGKVFTPEQCRLTDKIFEELMFIRCNNAICNEN